MIDEVSRSLIRLALAEDLAGYGDVTSAWTVAADLPARARIVARQDAVVSGLPLAAVVLAEIDPAAVFAPSVEDGASVAPGGALAEISGTARSVLAAERTMLNLLVHLCGVATHSRRFAMAVAGTRAVVVDTRKTTPGLRLWEKRAVRHGGCGNHRFGLFDMVLIKDNHLVAGGGVTEAVTRARTQASLGMKVEVEVTDEAGLRAALAAGADVVMLDNVPSFELHRLVTLSRELAPHVRLEASGTITIETVRGVAESGVDYISTSALTLGAPPVDLGLDFD